jgi:hypothetical protein
MSGRGASTQILIQIKIPHAMPAARVAFRFQISGERTAEADCGKGNRGAPRVGERRRGHTFESEHPRRARSCPRSPRIRGQGGEESQQAPGCCQCARAARQRRRVSSCPTRELLRHRSQRRRNRSRLPGRVPICCVRRAAPGALESAKDVKERAAI